MPNVCVDIFSEKDTPLSKATSPLSNKASVLQGKTGIFSNKDTPLSMRCIVNYVFMDDVDFEFMDGYSFTFT